MTDKRRKRKQSYGGSQKEDEPWKPNKDDLEIAQYMYRKLPDEECRFGGSKVRVFKASDAIELLMESPWTHTKLSDLHKKNSKPRLFTNESSVVEFMTNLLQKRIFYRAFLVKKKSSKKPSKAKVTKSVDDGVLQNLDCNAKSTESELTARIVTSEKSGTICSSSSNVGQAQAGTKTIAKSNSKKPPRIESADEQMFVVDDPESVYVWVYEPPPGLFTWFAGTVLLIGIILCCLFPVWPAQLRVGSYYLLMAASALFGLLLLGALIRFCLYIVVWIVTLGKYNFWLFPNYFEDVSVLESFRPLYSLTGVSPTSDEEKKLKSKKNKSVSKPPSPPGLSSARVTTSGLQKGTLHCSPDLPSTEVEADKTEQKCLIDQTIDIPNTDSDLPSCHKKDKNCAIYSACTYT